jgi:signal transduction histidine kinase
MIGLSLTLCVVFTMTLFMIVFTTEDQVFVNQLVAEKQLYDAHQADGHSSAWEPANRRMRLVYAIDQLPEALPDASRQRISKSTGVHEYFDAEQAYFVYHFMESGSARFLVYDVSDLLAVRGNKLPIFIIIVVTTLMVTIIAVLVAHRLVRRTLEPVRQLSHALQQGELDSVVIELAQQFSEDEIGVLTHELALALDRVRNAAQREYEFNRGVSHELRTPIQVAQSATELLELFAEKSTEESVVVPVERLRRSIDEMHEIAEAFLWLASERVRSPQDTCTVAALNKLVGTVATVFSSTEIAVTTTLPAEFEYPIPRSVMAVCVRNLLLNAITHGGSGRIDFIAQRNQISIRNPVGELSAGEPSFGIGLTIVQRLCERFNCELSIGQQSGHDYLASIVFSKVL